MDNIEHGQKFITKERILLDSKIEVKYPEKTWTVEQSFRDIYQNHLDAQFKVAVNSLLADLAGVCGVAVEEVVVLDNLRKVAYEYLATKDTMDPSIKEKMTQYLIVEIRAHAEDKLIGDIDLVELVDKHEVRLPRVELLVGKSDHEDGWVDARSVSDVRNVDISGWRISDEGLGYDATLKSILYSSDKNSPDQIGQFGEGGKMSEILLKERGFRIESRSAFNFTDGSGKHCVLWKSRPGKSAEGSMTLQITKVELEKPIPSGSVTEIRFSSDTVSGGDIHQFLDCINMKDRPQVLFEASREFREKVHYVHYNPNKPLVGIHRGLSGLMVQGIRVDPVNTENRFAFGYCTFDKNVMDARDRNKYSEAILGSVIDYWCHADKEILENYWHRCFRYESSEGNQKRYFEDKIMENILFSVYNNKEGVSKEGLEFVRNTLLELLENKLDLYGEEKIYFKDGNESHDFLSDLGEEEMFNNLKVVDIKKLPLRFPGGLLHKYFGDRCVTHDDLEEKFREGKEEEQGDVLSLEEYEQAERWYEDRSRAARDLLMGLGVDPKMIRRLYVSFVRNGSPFSVEECKEEEDYMYWGQAKRNSGPKNFLQVSWEKAKEIEDVRGFERSLAVYMLRGKDMQSPETAQVVANKAIRENWKGAVDPKLVEFKHEVDNEVLNSYLEEIIGYESLILSECFRAVERISKTKVESADLEHMVEILNGNKNLDIKFFELMVNNIFCTEKGFVRCVNNGGEDGYVLEDFGYDQMVSLGEVEGRRVYRYGDKVFIDLPPFDYVKYQSSVIYRHEDTLYRTNRKQAIGWEIESDHGSMKFGDGFCYFETYMGGDNDLALKVARVHLSEMTWVDRGSLEHKVTKLKDGLVSTSVSLEYGKGKWDHPVRFFEDVVQNHLNAGNVEIKFSVSRDGESFWVLASELLLEDTIEGIEFADDGNGYTPESLERMGKSDRDNPLDEGKYGEGTKMLLAAAARNQIELEFSSVCRRGEEEISWKATASETELGVIEKGARSSVKMAGFVLDSESSQSRVGSRTKIMFKDLGGEFYKNCLEVIDPRLESKGLVRYARKLEGGVEVRSAVGPVKVLNDDRGNIFENGLFITTKKTILGSLDVPDVCATRERDEIKEKVMQQYMNFLLSHTSDPDLIRTAIKQFVNNDRQRYLDIRNLFDESGSLPVNLGLWKMVAKEDFSNVIINDTSLPDFGKKYLKYHGFEKAVRIYNSQTDGRSKVLGAILPSISELKKQNQLHPIKVSVEVRREVERVVDILADRLLEVIESGDLPEAVNLEFVELLKDRNRLHESVEISRLHPTILGEAVGVKTIVSEGMLFNLEKLVTTLLHEWAHHLSLKSDLDTQFIACLLGIAEGGNQRAISRVK